MPQRLISHYIQHRAARHARVLNAVQQGKSDLADIAVEAYADSPDAHPALAEDQTLSHLLAHQREGNVIEQSGRWTVQSEART